MGELIEKKLFQKSGARRVPGHIASGAAVGRGDQSDRHGETGSDRGEVCRADERESSRARVY